MKRYYIGKRDDGTWEPFEWNDYPEPTLDETGYEVVEGPFDTLQEAKEATDK